MYFILKLMQNNSYKYYAESFSNKQSFSFSNYVLLIFKLKLNKNIKKETSLLFTLGAVVR